MPCDEAERRTEIALGDVKRSALPKCTSCERRHAGNTLCDLNDIEHRNMEIMRARVARAEEAFRDAVIDARRRDDSMARLDRRMIEIAKGEKA